ncbi:cytoplasmic protein [Brucella abortus str. 2308 A]|uniref:Uncharacterized protein n=5 Tax=Brucella TaxID=234 RepID=C0RG63_BRUMB|nr:hypothetical cytosolic protein [Brucella melitensis bv. 1 str. 16M]ABY39028.1 Hypothetical protein, conserved [Brucella suis ATCC 23445]ACO01885.1 Hypothetical protein, conserved [Brucella melitensis ATCC 23457]EEH15247.1 cytoplasmic protein [Brucella ceti str. Cudo]EEP62803.1 cytoplasmic protein [Brucella abortus str. 2308 A]EEY07306.1 conserved hypothetical protein [Brucella pinnipedialis M163/99/10]EEY27093.1 conserved hypothetical protein [Brucella sp. F5/99]EEZ19034.1 conserved hypot
MPLSAKKDQYWEKAERKMVYRCERNSICAVGWLCAATGLPAKSASPLMTAIVIRAPMSVHSIRAAPDLFFKKRIIKAGIADYLVCGECLDGAHFNVCQL